MDILDGRLQEILGELSEEASRVHRLAELNTQLESLTSQRISQQGALDTLRQTQAVLKEQQRLVENQGRQVQAGENALRRSANTFFRSPQRTRYLYGIGPESA